MIFKIHCLWNWNSAGINFLNPQKYKKNISRREKSIPIFLSLIFNPSFFFSIDIYMLGIQIRNMKMVLNIYGTWRRVTFKKTNDENLWFFFRLSRLIPLYCVKIFHLRNDFCTILYRVTKPLSRIKKIINCHH